MASNPLDLGDPTAVLLAVAEALRQAGVETATYGGLALAAYGEPRETKDADFAVTGLDGEHAAAALRAAGLAVVVAFDRLQFARRVRGLGWIVAEQVTQKDVGIETGHGRPAPRRLMIAFISSIDRARWPLR